MTQYLKTQELLKANNNWTIGTNNSVTNIISKDASINNILLEYGILNNNKLLNDILLEDNSNNKILNLKQIDELIKNNNIQDNSNILILQNLVNNLSNNLDTANLSISSLSGDVLLNLQTISDLSSNINTIISNNINNINNLNKSSIIKQVIKKNNLSPNSNSLYFVPNSNNSYLVLKYNIIFDFSLLSQLTLETNENGEEYVLTSNKILYIKLRRILINKYGDKVEDKYISVNKVGLNTNVAGFINSYSNTYIDFINHNYKVFYKFELYNSINGSHDNSGGSLINNIMQDGYILGYEFKNEINEDGYTKQIVFKRDISLNSDISNNYNTPIESNNYSLDIVPKYNNSKILINCNLNYLSSLHKDQYIEFSIKKIIYSSPNKSDIIVDSSSIISRDLLRISNSYGGYTNLYNYSYLDNINTANKVKYQLVYKLISPIVDDYNNNITNSYGILGYDQSFSNTISLTELNENNGNILGETISNNSDNIINSIYRHDSKYLYKQISYKNLENNLNIADYYITINPQLENSIIYLTFNINFLLSFYCDNLVSFSIYKHKIDLLTGEYLTSGSGELIKTYNGIGTKNANAYFTNKLNFELYDNNNNNYNLVKYYLNFEFQNNDLSNNAIMDNNSNFILAYEI
jgi:hypothetical protein